MEKTRFSMKQGEKRGKTVGLCGTRQAQVSLFIIVGLVLLVIIGVSIYLTQSLFMYPGLSAELRPVAQYLETCVEEVTVQGALLAGMQGGYIDIPQELRYNPDAHVEMGVTLPYWYVDGKSTAPSLGVVEEQLATFVKDHVLECVNEFEALEGPFAFEPLPEPQVSIDVQDTKILVDFNMPVKVRYGNTEQTLPTLDVKV